MVGLGSSVARFAAVAAIRSASGSAAGEGRRNRRCCSSMRDGLMPTTTRMIWHAPTSVWTACKSGGHRRLHRRSPGGYGETRCRRLHEPGPHGFRSGFCFDGDAFQQLPEALLHIIGLVFKLRVAFVGDGGEDREDGADSESLDGEFGGQVRLMTKITVTARAVATVGFVGLATCKSRDDETATNKMMAPPCSRRRTRSHPRRRHRRGSDDLDEGTLGCLMEARLGGVMVIAAERLAKGSACATTYAGKQRARWPPRFGYTSDRSVPLACVVVRLSQRKYGPGGVIPGHRLRFVGVVGDVHGGNAGAANQGEDVGGQA